MDEKIFQRQVTKVGLSASLMVSSLSCAGSIDFDVAKQDDTETAQMSAKSNAFTIDEVGLPSLHYPSLEADDSSRSFETYLRFTPEPRVKLTTCSIALVSWTTLRSPLETKPSKPNEETTAALNLDRRKLDSLPLRNINIRLRLVLFLAE